MNEEVVKLLLKQARSNIEDSSPNDALAALLHAIRLTQGEEAIVGILDQAKAKADEEQQIYNENDHLEIARRMSILLTKDESTVLYERGDENLLKEAFEDGSSVVCAACNSLVPRERFLQHQLYWCENASADLDDL